MAASRTEKKLARKISANISMVAKFCNVIASVTEAGNFLKTSVFTSRDYKKLVIK